MKRNSIKRVVSVEGRGLHTGVLSRVTFLPSGEKNGIIIRNNGEEYRINPGLVFDTKRGTSLRFGKSEVHTVEHMLAAIKGLLIDDVLIDLEGVEPPCADGSSLEYVKALKKAGICAGIDSAEPAVLKEPLVIKEAGKYMAALPYHCFKAVYFSDFSVMGIAPEEVSFELKQGSFEKEIAPARTFGFKNEIATLIKAGLIKGADEKNAILIEGGKPSNTKYRMKQELTRHKILDIAGDFALINSRVNVLVIAVKTGHEQNVNMAGKIYGMAGCG